jgi:LCP family protein required for cell wall assembly
LVQNAYAVIDDDDRYQHLARSSPDSPGGWRAAGLAIIRIGIAALSVAVVAVTGGAWWTAHHVVIATGITISHALAPDAPRSTPGAMNILLIGLDSRKDQRGNDLPAKILNQLHAGDSDDGGYNTNTMILAHIGSDDRVTAFSIPRDDYVAADGIPGYDHIKIKEAYGLTKADTEQTLIDQGVSDQQTLETKGREAGRAATLRAVRDLTGVPIDYFAEINLAGFYDLASALGTVQVCLNNAVYDDYSGADFPAGPQTLDAAQALAFVRQRHGLDNGDLDRTHRQQAFLISVMRQLQDAGSFTDLTKFNSLIAVARNDIVLSEGWGEDQFNRIGAIASGHVQFQTLPVLRYDTINDQDVNIVDPAAIKAQVTAAFNGAGSTTTTAPAAPSSIVDVSNAGSTSGLADSVSQWLGRRGYTAGDVRNTIPGEATATAVDYGAGSGPDANTIATLLGVSTAAHADSALAAGHVRVTLGDGYVLPAAFDQPDTAVQFTENTNSGTTAQASDNPDTSGTPDQGPPVTGDSIPCVN